MDFEARPAEVQQQTQMKASRFQVVYALRGVRRVECLAGFQLDDDCFLNHQIGDIVSDDNAVVVNRDTLLLRDRKPRFAQFMGQGVLVNLLQKPSAKRIQHVKCATNDTLRQRIGPDLICVHQRASAAKSLSVRAADRSRNRSFHPPVKIQ
jgi:hypothetical protein